MLRRGLGRVDVCGKTCGVETKHTISLDKRCSGMHSYLGQ